MMTAVSISNYKNSCFYNNIIINIKYKDDVMSKDWVAQLFERVKDSQPTVHTNNCWGNVDYSPLAPTDKLNVKVPLGWREF